MCGDNDVFYIHWIKTKFPNVVDNNMQALAVSGVNYYKAVTGINEVSADGAYADKIKIPKNFRGFDVFTPSGSLNHFFLTPTSILTIRGILPLPHHFQ